MEEPSSRTSQLLIYPSWFARSAQRLVQLTESRREQIIQRIKPAILVPAFIYPDSASQRIGMRSLLLVASHLISHVFEERNPEDDDGLEMIVAILTRKEFDLSVLKAESDLEDLFVEYRAQLVLVLKVLIVAIVRAKSKRKSIMGRESASASDSSGDESSGDEKKERKSRKKKRAEDVRDLVDFGVNPVVPGGDDGDYARNSEAGNEEDAVFEMMEKRFKVFCINLLPILYFKIPFICKHLLDLMCLKTKQPEECEYKWQAELLVDIDALVVKKTTLDITESIDTSSNSLLLQWSRFTSPDDSQTISLLLENADDIKSVLREHHTFFSFVKGVLQYAYRNSFGGIVWGRIPGYWTLFRACISKIMDIDPVEYSFLARSSCLEFCRNPELVSCFTRCCLYRTRSIDRAAVSYCLDILDEYFEIGSSDGRLDSPLSETFCYSIFFEAIRALLCSEDFQILCKTLSFLYMNLGRFYGSEREQLLLIILLKDFFFRLFPHWSFTVRRYYQHILIYKIKRRGFIHDYSSAVSSAKKIPSNNALSSLESVADSQPSKSGLINQATTLISSIITSPISSVSSLISIASPFSFFSNSVSSTSAQTNGYNLSNTDEKKNETDEERQHRESLESIDAENCSVISSRLTLMEVQEDEMIENTLIEYIKCVQEEIEGKSSAGSIPKNLFCYCSRALKEFHQGRHQAIMLQRRYSSLLSCFEVVAPDLYFDITTFSSDES